MAILDALNEYCDAVSIAHAAGTFLIGNQIDHKVKADYGHGTPMFLVIGVDTDIVAAGAGTVAFALASDDTATIDPTTGTKHFWTPDYVTASSASGLMKAGATLFVAAMPVDFGLHAERYSGILCRVATQTISSGKVNAYLTPDAGLWRAYARAVN